MARISDGVREAIRQARRDGDSLNTIAVRFNVAKSTVRAICNEGDRVPAPSPAPVADRSADDIAIAAAYRQVVAYERDLPMIEARIADALANGACPRDLKDLEFTRGAMEQNMEAQRRRIERIEAKRPNDDTDVVDWDSFPEPEAPANVVPLAKQKTS